MAASGRPAGHVAGPIHLGPPRGQTACGRLEGIGAGDFTETKVASTRVAKTCSVPDTGTIDESVD
jgi:hypothetical protein